MTAVRGYRAAMATSTDTAAAAGTETAATLAGAVAPAPTTAPGARDRAGALTWDLTRNPAPADAAQRTAVLAEPGFGRYFTDHMATAEWTAADGWQDGRIRPYGPFSLSPASAVLHYAQEIFEGLKAYRHADGSVHLFRPELNARRFAASAHRLALPPLPVEDFLASLEQLVRADADWVPAAPGPGGAEATLYLRPMMFANESFLGVRPAACAQYAVIASPAGAYFSRGPVPVSLWVSEHFTRAAPGGTGAAKCGGNYAASLLPQQEALAHGCDQVIFLDAVERRYIDELGGMNLFVVRADGSVLTPALNGSILEGVTRDAILALGAELGLIPREEPVELDRLRADLASGAVTEVFACGTAAVVAPVGSILQSGHGDLVLGEEPGPVTASIRTALLDLQYGRRPDPAGWLRRVL